MSFNVLSKFRSVVHWKKKNNNDKKYDILPKMPFPVQADGNVLVRHYSLQFVKLGPTDLGT